MLNLKAVELLSGSALVTTILVNAVGLEPEAVSGQYQAQVGQPRVCCEKQNGGAGAGAAQAAAPEDGWPVKMGGNHIESQATSPEDGWPVKMGGNRPDGVASTTEDGWPVKMGGNRPEGLAVVAPAGTPEPTDPAERRRRVEVLKSNRTGAAADLHDRSVGEVPPPVTETPPTKNHRVLGLTRTQWGWIGGVLGAVALGAVITDDDDSDRDRPVGPDGR